MSTPEIVAIIPAAGTSTRMGMDLPKPLIRLSGKTILERTVATFLRVERLTALVVTSPAELQAAFSDLLHSAFPSASKKIVVTLGGASRQESVKLGIGAAQKLIRNPDDAVIAIHDCARCLASVDLINRAIDGALKFDAVTVAVPVIDTIKRANQEGIITETLDRSTLWQIQTPQVFRFGLLKRAHHAEIKNATDDAALVEQFAPVRIVEGARRNLKITTPEDLLIAEALLRE